MLPTLNWFDTCLVASNIGVKVKGVWVLIQTDVFIHTRVLDIPSVDHAIVSITPTLEEHVTHLCIHGIVFKAHVTNHVIVDSRWVVQFAVVVGPEKGGGDAIGGSPNVLGMVEENVRKPNTSDRIAIDEDVISILSTNSGNMNLSKRVFRQSCSVMRVLLKKSRVKSKVQIGAYFYSDKTFLRQCSMTFSRSITKHLVRLNKTLLFLVDVGEAHVRNQWRSELIYFWNSTAARTRHQ